MNTCATCRHFRTVLESGESLCTAKLPKLTVVPLQQPAGQIAWARFSCWPQVQPTDRCGKYTPELVSGHFVGRGS